MALSDAAPGHTPGPASRRRTRLRHSATRWAQRHSCAVRQLLNEARQADAPPSTALDNGASTLTTGNDILYLNSDGIGESNKGSTR